MNCADDGINCLERQRLEARIKWLEAEVRRYASEAVTAYTHIEALEAALREAERFVSYLANETDGHFVGSGTPTTCLVMIRAALAPEQDK